MKIRVIRGKIGYIIIFHIPKLANDLKNELPELKGFSERSLGYRLRLAKEYPILQQAAAKLAAQQVFS